VLHRVDVTDGPVRYARNGDVHLRTECSASRVRCSWRVRCSRRSIGCSSGSSPN